MDPPPIGDFVKVFAWHVPRLQPTPWHARYDDQTGFGFLDAHSRRCLSCVPRDYACRHRVGDGALPRLDGPRHDAEQRMRHRRRDGLQSSRPRRVPDAQLGQQMAPLVCHLPLCYPYGAGSAGAVDPVGVEAVAAHDRLRVDAVQVGGNRGGRRRLSPEPFQLGMAPVAARPAEQHGLRQQALAPRRRETARVEVLRMQAPDAHAVSA